MRETRDALKRKLGDFKYQALISPFKAILRNQMHKDDTGPVETAQWFIEAMRRKKKLTPTAHAALIATAYELIEEKA